MARRGWKHRKVPEGFVHCDDAARIRACEAARVRVVWLPDPSGAVAFLPEWAARAPEGTSCSMLRHARRDPEARAALVAAGRIAPLQPRLTNTWAAQAQEADRMLAEAMSMATPSPIITGITALDDALNTGFKPGALAPVLAARVRR